MSANPHPVDEVLPDTQAADARASARPRHVCRRRRGSPHSRPRAQDVAGGRRLPDQRRPVRLRRRDPDPERRFPGRRHSPAGDDGRDLRVGRADAVDGQCSRHRHPRHLRLGHCRRRVRLPGCSLRQQTAAAFSASGDRHHHHGDRHLADAGRHQLGGRRPADADQGGRRRARRSSPTRPMASFRGSASRCSC